MSAGVACSVTAFKAGCGSSTPITTSQPGYDVPNIPTRPLLFGIFFVLSTATFVYVPAGQPWSDYVSMMFFGYTVYALVTYLGGLMAVDICSKKATGAAMGVIGLFSYAGASLQEAVGGYLINAHKAIGTDGKAIYDFTAVGNFWVIASVFALVLPLLVWNAKHED